MKQTPQYPPCPWCETSQIRARGHFSRYALLICAGVLIAGTAAPAAVEEKANQPATDQIAAIERHIGGRIGIAVLDVASGRGFEYRATDRFPMCSTFKFLAAAAVLRRIDQKQENLDRRISYTTVDLLEWAPITREHMREGSMTLDALCAAAIEYSDNTAGNLLLRTIGGPAKLTDYVRSLGDSITRLDRVEPDLNSAIKGDERDTTSPPAMLGDIKTLLLEDGLSPESRERLTNWLVANTTGAKRLRAGLPPTWRIGDKTGTGDNGAVGDIAIAWPPNRPPILIAVYLADSTASAETLNEAFVETAQVIASLNLNVRIARNTVGDWNAP
jgi:beta-lactamase class A